MAAYDPREYWLARGKVYREQFRHDSAKQLQEAMLLDYLKGITSFETVLEVGCGFGRISGLILSNFPGVRDYLAIDLSPDQLESARHYAGSDRILFVESDLQSLHVRGTYDLVLAVEVLMHIVPQEIEHVLARLVDCSKLHVVNVDYFEQPQPERLASHNFIHQYEAAYRKLSSVKSVTRVPIIRRRVLSALDSKQSIFHATVVR